MRTTGQTLEKYCVREEPETSCTDGWCDGPESETLPCFTCFDPAQDYVLTTTRGASSE